MHRLFVAIELPQVTRDALARLQGGLPDVRWMDDTQMHLTLRFIGEVDGPAFEDIAVALSAVECERFSLALSGLGHFPPRGKPKTLWAGVDPSPDLIRLRDKVETALAALGFAHEKRNYQPHVTLARSSAGIKQGPLGAYLTANALFRAPPFAVSSFALFSSYLTHDGARYTVEAEYPLVEHVDELPIAQNADD